LRVAASPCSTIRAAPSCRADRAARYASWGSNDLHRGPAFYGSIAESSSRVRCPALDAVIWSARTRALRVARQLRPVSQRDLIHSRKWCRGNASEPMLIGLARARSCFATTSRERPRSRRSIAACRTLLDERLSRRSADEERVRVTTATTSTAMRARCARQLLEAPNREQRDTDGDGYGNCATRLRRRRSGHGGLGIAAAGVTAISTRSKARSPRTVRPESRSRRRPRRGHRNATIASLFLLPPGRAQRIERSDAQFAHPTFSSTHV